MDSSAMDGLSDETRAVLQQAMKALNFGEKSRPVANGTPDPPRLLKPPSVGAGQRGSGSGGYWPGAARPESKDSSGPHLQILGGGSAVPDVARVIEEKVSQDARAKGAVQVEDARHQQARVKREVEAMIRDIRARARGPALPAEQSGGAGLPGGRPPSSPPEPSTAPTPAAMPARPPPSPGRGASDNGILFAPSPGQFTTVQQEHQPVGGSEGDKPVRVQRVHVPISFERFDGKVVVQQPPTVPGELGELSDATGVPAAPAAASPPRARRTSSKPENSEAFWDQVISDLRQSQYVAMLDALDDLRGAEMEKAASELRGRGTSRADVSLDVSFPSSMNSSRAPSPARAAARRELAKYDVEHDRSVGEAGPSGASAGPSLSGSFSSLHEHLAQPLDPLDSILGPSYGAPPSATGARVTHDPALPWRQGFGPGASAADRPAVRRSPAAEQLAAERLAAEARLREAYQQRLLRQSLGDEPLNPPGAAGPGRVNGSNGSRQQEQSHSLKASSIAAAGLTTNLDASLRGSMSASLNASLDTSALRLSSSALDERILSASLGEGWHPGASPPTQRAPSIHTSPAAPPAQQPAAAAPRVAAPPAARPHIFAPADSVDDTLSRSALWSSLSGSVGGGASVVVDVGGGGMSYTESLLARARRQPQAAPPHPSTVPVSKQSAPRTSPKVLAVAPMQLPSLAAASPPPPPASFGAVPALAAHPAAQQGFGLGAALRSRISPPAPVGVTCSANVDGAAATFELTQVGDALETRYEVQLRFESGEVPDEFRTAYLGSEARCEIQGLKHGSVFSCRARAVTSDDYSDFTPVVQFATPAPPRGLARTEQWVSRQRASAESTRRASDSVPLSYGAGLPGGMPYGGLGHGVPQRYSEHDFAGLSDLERRVLAREQLAAGREPSLHGSTSSLDSRALDRESLGLSFDQDNLGTVGNSLDTSHRSLHLYRPATFSDAGSYGALPAGREIYRPSAALGLTGLDRLSMRTSMRTSFESMDQPSLPPAWSGQPHLHTRAQAWDAGMNPALAAVLMASDAVLPTEGVPPTSQVSLA